MTKPSTVAGIDVSKRRLDVCVLPQGASYQVASDAAGYADLAQRLCAQGVGLVVMEASGGFEQAAAQALSQTGMLVRVVDPKRVRYFARALGQLAKSDPIDARVIAEFGQMLTQQAPLVAVPFAAARAELAALVGGRQNLVKHRTGLQNQIATSTDRTTRRVLAAALTPLERAIKRFDQLIATAVAAHPPFAALARRLDTVPGLGPVAIPALIAWLPELGRLNGRQIAALVGVAPFDQDSGQHKGQRHIQGGRAQLRSVLYMAIGVAGIQHNPVLKRLYRRLRQRGKLAKVAQIACVRKLLAILTVMLAKQQDWQPPQLNAA